MSEMINETVVDGDILQPLNEMEVDALLELYKHKCGATSFQYLLIYTQCNWNKRLKSLHIGDNDEQWKCFRKDFYTHRSGDFRIHGTYICLHDDLIQSISFHSWEPNFNELLECLRKTQLIDWKNGPLLINVAPEYSDEIKKIAMEKGATIERARSCQGSILLCADALKLNVPSLPEGYKLDQLHENNADLIHSLWANNKEGSLEYIKGLMKINKSLGIFKMESNELVGWIFQNEFSGLGILEVVPSEQRKGFGTILARALSKLIAESQTVNLSAWAVVGNYKSQTLLEYIGYQKAVVYEWIQLI